MAITDLVYTQGVVYGSAGPREENVTPTAVSKIVAVAFNVSVSDEIIWQLTRNPATDNEPPDGTLPNTYDPVGGFSLGVGWWDDVPATQQTIRADPVGGGSPILQTKLFLFAFAGAQPGGPEDDALDGVASSVPGADELDVTVTVTDGAYVIGVSGAGGGSPTLVGITSNTITEVPAGGTSGGAGNYRFGHAAVPADTVAGPDTITFDWGTVFGGKILLGMSFAEAGAAETIVNLDPVSAQAAPVAFPHTAALDVVAASASVINLTVFQPGETVVDLPVTSATGAVQPLALASGLSVTAATAALQPLLLASSVPLLPVTTAASAQPLLVGDFLPVVTAAGSAQPLALRWDLRPVTATAAPVALAILGAAQTIEEVFRLFLLASPYVVEVVGDRVYQPRAPQNATYPLLVIRKTDVEPSDDHGYLAGHVVTRYRVMAASRNYGDAVNLRTALRGLAGFSLAEAQRSGRSTVFNSANVAIQSVLQVFEHDRFEEDAQLFVATMDYEVTHTELAPTGIQ